MVGIMENASRKIRASGTASAASRDIPSDAAYKLRGAALCIERGADVPTDLRLYVGQVLRAVSIGVLPQELQRPTRRAGAPPANWFASLHLAIIVRLFERAGISKTNAVNVMAKTCGVSQRKTWNAVKEWKDEMAASRDWQGSDKDQRDRLLSEVRVATAGGKHEHCNPLKLLLKSHDPYCKKLRAYLMQ